MKHSILHSLLIAAILICSLSIQAQTPARKGYIYIVNNPAGLYMRKQPDINAKRIAAISTGHQLFTYAIPHGEIEIDSIKGYWFKVYYRDLEGYMFSGYLLKVMEMELELAAINEDYEQEEELTKELKDTVVLTTDSKVEIKDTVDLVKDSTEEITEDITTIHQLKEISQELLAQITKLKKDTLIPHHQADVKIELIDTTLFQLFCEKKYTDYFKITANNQFHLIEYFYFIVNKKGQITNITDERTEVNKNTGYITQTDISDLLKMKFEPASRNDTIIDTKVPLGIGVDVKRIHYRVKIKEDKIRWYKIPLFVEYIKQDNPHYAIIMNEKNTGKQMDGKYDITLLEGNYSLYELSGKEYNPFYQKCRNLFEKSFYSITEFNSHYVK